MKQIIFYIAIAFLLAACNRPTPKYLFAEGFIYGTVYHVTYESPDGQPLDEGIVAAMKKLDNSLSTFNKTSTLSKINSNESMTTDSMFEEVFGKSQLVSELTDGAFDPTVAPLVNVWGFGFKEKQSVTPEMIDSLLQFTGFHKVKTEANQLIKSDNRIMLDFSAIAKGYAVDLVGRYLENAGCKNYMVEIGGEVVTQGKNPTKEDWRIGINEPKDDEPMVTDEFQAILSISNKAIATSGNYRNFYVEGGKKYAHTIDPKTGFPVTHSLLSATVVANNCVTADAFATAFMVLGWEKALEVCSKIDTIDAYLIIDNGTGGYDVKTTTNFNRFLSE